MKKFIFAAIASVLLSTAASADPFAVFVNERNGLSQLDVNSARAIYSGRVDEWDKIPGGSGLQGEIFALALAPGEPESQAFLSAVNLTSFGPNVLVLRGPFARLIIAVAAEVIPNVIGVDNPSAARPHDKTLAVVKNFALLSNSSGNGLTEINIPTALSIFAGTVTDWSDVPDSGLSGPILALRLADPVPSTQAFKSYINLNQYSPDINVVRGTMAPFIIAVTVANNSKAIGVSNPTPLVAGDRDLPIFPY